MVAGMVPESWPIETAHGSVGPRCALGGPR